CCARELELVQVAVDRLAGGTICLYEGRVGGAARERLEPHRPRAGEQVEHACLVHSTRPDQVEGGLADAVPGWSGVGSLRREDACALARARDNPHGKSLGAAEIPVTWKRRILLPLEDAERPGRLFADRPPPFD